MRAYTMTARAEAAAAASERILDAAEELFWENPGRRATLAEIADRAGVSVHSILRRYDSYAGLMDVTARRSIDRVRAQRDEALPDDMPGSVAVLVDHYEETGERVLAMLAAAERVPEIRPYVEIGRVEHADWCERVFAAALKERRGAARRRLHAQLIAICDVETWNLLRNVRGLSRRETERALVEMLEPLVEGSRS
jgi:AcrR family transcriptional regulator